MADRATEISDIASGYGMSVQEYKQALIEHAESRIGWQMNFAEYAACRTLSKRHG